MFYFVAGLLEFRNQIFAGKGENLGDLFGLSSIREARRVSKHSCVA